MTDLGIEDAFTLVYRENRWGNEESASGPGSTINSPYVHQAINALRKAVDELHVVSISDIGCGDFNWMPLFLNERPGIKYHGLDIVADLITRNRAKHPDYDFQVFDATTMICPEVDLIFCKDLMSHLKSRHVALLLSSFKKSGSRYLLASNEGGDTNEELNTGIPGAYRPINLMASPYGFPPALWEEGYLALWDLAALDFQFFDRLIDRVNLAAERASVERCRYLEYRIAELESELQSRPAYGTEQFQLMAAERRRDHMRAVQPHLPISTAGVFSYSQHQQELFALEHLNFKRNGFFVEIGVATGREYSNTYLLETYFGWQGILCEPNSIYADAIRGNRSAVLDTRAAYSRSGDTVKFLCVPGIYGLLSTISEFKHSDYHSRFGDEIDVATVSLEDLLTEHSAPRTIDYMSIDTEGAEIKIMENFDFAKWDIRVMTIEHNFVPGRIDEYDRILLPFGYKRVLAEVSGGDGWYVRD